LRFDVEPENAKAMEDLSKKSQRADLENKRLIFWQVGAIISLALVFFAFEYRSEATFSIRDFNRSFVDAPFEIVPPTVHPEKLLPPPPASSIRIEVVDNSNMDVKPLNINAEVSQNEPIKYDIPKIEDEVIPDDTPHLSPEVAPEFPGGLEALMSFLSKNIRYPAQARDQQIQGRVYLSFVVERDGSVSNITLLRGIGFGCDEEAIRVVGLMPTWKPGRQNGIPVRVYYNLPIKFTLR